MTSVGNETEIFVNQTRIFVETFDDLLRNKGFRRPSRGRDFATKLLWHDPEKRPLKEVDDWKEYWAKTLSRADCVVLLRNHQDYDLDFIKKHARFVVQAQDHVYDPFSEQSLTATQRKSGGDEHTNVTVAYTGIIPIVYKAQRNLLESLINSIGLAFIMILIVMMVLLRDWRRRVSLRNSLNLPGGLVSMLPNLFPIAIIFGAMGWTAILANNGILFDKPLLVDIGTMMTASVAMGIAVDDTIHFLNWFRYGLRRGLPRNEAIALAYERVATAMTQTTVIGGFGLAVFAFSTFMPTHAFGLMMLILLFMALIGDLIFLPALLAGPLGRFFEVSAIKQAEQAPSTEPDIDSTDRDTTPHRTKPRTGSPVHIRVDAHHKGSGP